MRIAILGSGRMGGTLGGLWADAGHAVTFSFSRDQAKLERLARAHGPRARAASPAEAVRDSDVVLLAVLWQQVPQALRAAGNLRGKVLIVARLARDLGYAPVDCGALSNARYLEPLAMLVGELAYNQRRRPEVGLRFLRPTKPRRTRGQQSKTS
jgi:predicted dinucleotide-binding enzyme